MKFNENDTADIEMELKLPADDLKTMQAPSNVNCDLFFPKDDKDGPEFVVEDRSADGNMHCVGSAKGQPLNKTSAGGETSITNEDGIYTLKSEALPVNLTQGLDELGITTNANIVFEFPGEVLESNVGTVDGNKVTVTDLNQLKQSMTIKAKSTPGGGDILMWVLVGVGILLLLGLVLWLLLRKKGPKNGQAPTGPGYGPQAGPHDGGQPHPGQQYGGQPQHYQPPQQGQPPQGQPPQGPQNPDQR